MFPLGGPLNLMMDVAITNCFSRWRSDDFLISEYTEYCIP